LLYWCKSTDTDADCDAAAANLEMISHALLSLAARSVASAGGATEGGGGGAAGVAAAAGVVAEGVEEALAIDALGQAAAESVGGGDGGTCRVSICTFVLAKHVN